MQFPVPQFLDVEDKIIGPFSLKQFGFVAGGGLLDLALFKIFGVGIILFLFGIPITLLTLYISFGKFNGKQVYEAVPVFVKFLTAPKVMVFQKERSVSDLNIGPITIEQINAVAAKAPSNVPQEEVQTQLKRLSRLLDQKNAEENEIVNKKQ
jgi:hypothetical protein